MSDDALRKWRLEKDAAFAQEGQSPLDPEAIGQFDGLRYYDANPALRFEVSITAFDQVDSVEMETSTGQPATYERYGRVEFSVDGQAVALTVFRNPQQAGWFLPFRDTTSGGETYGAGRYVELEEEGGGFVLDFNYAYNPFCAYAPHWVCPVPPAENTLAVAIAAGEKTYS